MRAVARWAVAGFGAIEAYRHVLAGRLVDKSDRGLDVKVSVNEAADVTEPGAGLCGEPEGSRC